MSGRWRALIAAACVLAPALAWAQAASAPAADMPASGAMKAKKPAANSTDKAGKPPVDQAASMPTAKKPAKAGAQSGPSASDPPK